MRNTGKKNLKGRQTSINCIAAKLYREELESEILYYFALIYTNPKTLSKNDVTFNVQFHAEAGTELFFIWSPTKNPVPCSILHSIKEISYNTVQRHTECLWLCLLCNLCACSSAMSMEPKGGQVRILKRTYLTSAYISSQKVVQCPTDLRSTFLLLLTHTFIIIVLYEFNYQYYPHL